MDHESTLINGRVHAARCDLSEGLGMLEQRFTGAVSDAVDTVRTATSSVSRSATAIAESVCETWASASHHVRDALDVRQRIRERPWAGFGGAVVAGFLAGFLPRRSRIQPLVNGSQRPGVWQTLGDSLRRELVGVGETAIAAAAAALRTNVTAMAQSACAGVDQSPSSPPSRNCVRSI